jgi:UDP-2,3-diacylglucosamine pyrophosphatase LpxH
MIEGERHRALFLSDIHLGLKSCQADAVVEFLRRVDADTIYLVGDIIDGWALKSGWHWPQPHNDVVQKLLRKARKGSRIIYLPGNHDEFLRDYFGSHFGGVEVQDRAVHETADGRRYLVIHGDQFDFVIRHAPWLAHLGDAAYDFALWLNRWVSLVRRRLGLPYWSLSAWAKLKVKNAVSAVGKFEEALASEARKLDLNGVICGHIHHAIERDIGGITYLNTGDWVESRTAIVEHYDGRMEILRFDAMLKAEKEAERAAEPVAALPLRKKIAA